MMSIQNQDLEKYGQLNNFQLLALTNSCSLFNAGILPHRHPKRYYQYALLDALDKPFASFRYYTCSWGAYLVFHTVRAYPWGKVPNS